MSFDVFISYSTKDLTAAKAACAALESAKIRCWMAPRDIVPGARWGASIVRAINECRVMVRIFSGNANASEQVHREVDRAFSKGRAVVPLRIEDVSPADELAYYLDTVHWLDALTPPLERNLEKLVATVQALITKEKQDQQTVISHELIDSESGDMGWLVNHSLGQGTLMALGQL
jgi:TIR domain-containing protein